MIDNLELYRIFHTVARLKSLTKAADELFISQPSASAAIKNLESRLGVKLFNRVARGMELTDDAGKKLFEVVDEAIRMLERVEDELNGEKTSASGLVRIAAADEVTNYFLLKYVKEFKEANPDVSFVFINGTSKDCLDNVREDRADVGFVNLPVVSSSVCFTGQTGQIHDVFVASSKYESLFGKTVPLSSISDYPLLMLDCTASTRRKIDEFTKELNIKFTPEIELNSVDLLTAMAANGLGIACVPREYVKKELESGVLTEIKTEPSLPVRAIGVVTNKKKSASHAVNAFLKLLNKYETRD